MFLSMNLKSDSTSPLAVPLLLDADYCIEAQALSLVYRAASTERFTSLR